MSTPLMRSVYSWGLYDPSRAGEVGVDEGDGGGRRVGGQVKMREPGRVGAWDVV
jgi:hypothetical protein